MCRGNSIHKVLRNIAIIAIILIPDYIYSTDYDTEFWAGAETNWYISKDFGVEISPEIRYYKNLSDIKSILFNFGAFWKVNDYIKTGAYWRKKFVDPDTGDEYIPRQVYYAYLQGSYESYRLETSLRLRYQMEEKPDKNWDEEYIRAKLKFEYNLIGEADPYAYIEYFYRMNYKYADQVDKYRLSIGLNIKTYEDQKLGVYYLYEADIIDKNPLNAHIMGFSYSFDISMLKFM